MTALEDRISMARGIYRNQLANIGAEYVRADMVEAALYAVNFREWLFSHAGIDRLPPAVRDLPNG